MPRSQVVRLSLIVLAAVCCSAQPRQTPSPGTPRGRTRVTLAGATVPPTGQAGVTYVSISGTGFPNGPILPTNTVVTLELLGGAARVTTRATAIDTIAATRRGRTTRRITFLIPSEIIVANPTLYYVSVSGEVPYLQFAGTNRALLTINPGNPNPAISSVTPSSGVAGQSLTVTIIGSSTHFVQGSTKASLGAGVSVGGAANGTLGPVTVNSATSATAQLVIDPTAAAGPRDVTVQTGSESATLSGRFGVTIPSSTAISAMGIAPASVAYSVPTAVTTTVTVTGTPDAGSVMLQRLDSSGRVLAILGTLHDDGLKGDAKANDGVFTLQTPFTEFAVGSVSLRVSATFSGAVNHVFSPTGTLTVTGTPPPTVTITSPASLSYLNLSPTTVTGTVSDSNATVVINSISAPVANGAFSATIPLAEGPNILTATATSASGAAGSASITVTLDTTPPHVTITSPPDKFVTTDSSISVAGNVNDIVVGTVNSQQAQVKVNGIASQVANRTFLATNVPLSIGSNTIQAVAVDRSGNSATTQITVTRQTPQPGQIQLTSGNTQTGTIGSTLPAPLAITLTDASGNPAANKQVIFTVTQNNGLLSVAGGTPAASAMVTTNAQGQATATWKLGMRSGAGSDGVQAYSVGSSGTAIFTATANQGAPGMIVVDSGGNQTAAVDQPLPKPLIVVVTDAGHNRLANVPVTFTVKQGGGSFAGQPSIAVTTDSDGRAAATLTLGFQEGNSNNQVTADFPGNTGFPVSFTASGRGPGNPAITVISGLVQDNSNQPIPGVTVRAVLTNVLNSNSNSVQAAATVQTDANGRFSIFKAPIGFVKLLVDGSTATVPGAFPTLDYDMVTVAGQINTIGQSIYLLPIKTNNQLCVTASTGGGTLTIPEAPGFSLTFGPGQVTFPGGSKTGCVSVTVVHPDKVPMLPGFGQQPRFIVTIQPSGALFNPPAPITLPNVDGLAPREVTEMYSFDHDISSFVAIGTGAVSDDGQVIRSNPGVGVLKAGWHCGGNPTAAGAAATCGPCAVCDGQQCQIDQTRAGLRCLNPCLAGGSGTCTSGHCTGQFQPAGAVCGAGGICDGMGNCTFGGSGGGGCSNCNSGNPCVDDSCGANNQCVATPNQLCQNACTGKAVGATCTVGNLTGTCDSNGNCNLCGALGANASCTCAGGVIGMCNSSGQCTVNGQSCGGPSSITVTELRSDQIPGVRANYLLAGTGSEHLPYIMMGTRDDSNAYVTVTVTVAPDTPETRAKALVALIRSDQRTMVEAPALSNIINLSFSPTPLSFDYYRLAYGIDLNGDGHLDPSEIINDTRWQFRVASRGLYTSTKLALLVGGLLPGITFPDPSLPIASAFLLAFVNDNAGSIPDALSVADIVSINELDENTGAVFGGTGTAPVVHDYFSNPSTVYGAVMNSQAMHDAAVLTINNSKAGIKNLMLATPVGGTQEFTLQLIGNTGNPSGMEFAFSIAPPYPQDQDLGLAFHFVNLNASLQITVAKNAQSYQIMSAAIVDSSATTKATISDVYQWGNGDSPVVVQAGYNTVGEAGHVFKSTVFIGGPLASVVGYEFQ